MASPRALMPGVDILALDFDGVLCDGMREYFEASRRTHTLTWPDVPAPGAELLDAFRALRPVILSGWEMPLLLHAIVERRPESAIARDWEGVRAELLGAGPLRGAPLVDALTRRLDDVRRAWIAADREDWLAHHEPYGSLEGMRRLVAEAERAVLVTTKEGEFARLILDHWNVRLADVQGKESGTHKCDNLRTLIGAYTATRGRRPRVWFVEDRLETLRHVASHADLDDVGLFLADWGYNTPATRAAVRDDGRIHLLEHARFARGLTAWL